MFAPKDYVYKDLTGIAYTTDTCAAICYMDTTAPTACSFFALDAGTCFLGNINSSTGYTTSLAALTAHLNESKFKH